MNYLPLFDAFWACRSAYLGLNNPTRTYENLRTKMAEFQTIAEIDDYVCTLKTSRESTRRIMVEFFRYLEKKGHGPIESVLPELKFYDYPFERQLEIAKFLHEPRTGREIEEHFNIDERTRRKDLQALEDGIEVLGSTIRIAKERRNGKFFYKSTMHPIFLPLNLTEVYALTTYMERVAGTRGPNATILSNLSGRIKSQLSDYAFERLFPAEDRSRYQNHYVDDESLAHQREGILMYLMKSGLPCKFFWKGDAYRGHLEYCRGKYHIILEDGSTLEAPLDEVDFVIESLKYR